MVGITINPKSYTCIPSSPPLKKKMERYPTYLLPTCEASPCFVNSLVGIVWYFVVSDEEGGLLIYMKWHIAVADLEMRITALA